MPRIEDVTGGAGRVASRADGLEDFLARFEDVRSVGVPDGDFGDRRDAAGDGGVG